jgi:hypothetical protein
VEERTLDLWRADFVDEEVAARASTAIPKPIAAQRNKAIRRSFFGHFMGDSALIRESLPEKRLAERLGRASLRVIGSGRQN